MWLATQSMTLRKLWFQRSGPDYVFVRLVVQSLICCWVTQWLTHCSVIYNSLWPHVLQHARLPCPVPSPWVCEGGRSTYLLIISQCQSASSVFCVQYLTVCNSSMRKGLVQFHRWRNWGLGQAKSSMQWVCPHSLTLWRCPRQGVCDCLLQKSGVEGSLGLVPTRPLWHSPRASKCPSPNSCPGDLPSWVRLLKVAGLQPFHSTTQDVNRKREIVFKLDTIFLMSLGSSP